MTQRPRLYQTPRTYADCPPESQACPHVGCRHNTYLDIQRGKVRVNARRPPGHPDLAPCCSLRYAAAGDMPYEAIGEVMGLHWRGVQAIEQTALAKIKAMFGEAGIRSLRDLLSHGFDDVDDPETEE